jgi:uncharacterized membrane protein YccC
MKYFTLNAKAISFALRVVLGCIIVWWSLYYLHDDKKVWALVSVIVVSDPNFDSVRSNLISRIINTIIGCFIGLLLIYVIGVSVWALMVGIALSVIISTSFKNYPSSWKLAPITVVIVIAPSIVANAAWREAMVIALTRTGEVLYGSIVAFALGFIALKVDRVMEKKNTMAEVKHIEEHE